MVRLSTKPHNGANSGHTRLGFSSGARFPYALGSDEFASMCTHVDVVWLGVEGHVFAAQRLQVQHGLLRVRPAAKGAAVSELKLSF